MADGGREDSDIDTPPPEGGGFFPASTRNAGFRQTDSQSTGVSRLRVSLGDDPQTFRSHVFGSVPVFKRAGIGRRTRHYKPGGGVKSLGAWLAAVMTMKGQSNQMAVADAVSLIHATPPAARSQFGHQIWALRRKHGTDQPGEVPF